VALALALKRDLINSESHPLIWIRCDVIFVVASVTSENQHFLNKSAFSKMKAGSTFVLISRANIVNFEDLMDAVESKHIVAASDVFQASDDELDSVY
jgi:phosphoglycerate dehydrogenase-like enzyme